jgi:hypothetical protein
MADHAEALGDMEVVVVALMVAVDTVVVQEVVVIV